MAVKPPRLLSVPLAGLDRVTVVVSDGAKFRSPMVTLENGWIVPVVGWPDLVPVIVGATVPATAMTVVEPGIAAVPAVSVSLTVMIVVTVWPGATWCAVGVKISASRAALTVAVEPIMDQTPAL